MTKMVVYMPLKLVTGLKIKKKYAMFDSIHRDVIETYKSVGDNTILPKCANPALTPAFPI